MFAIIISEKGGPERREAYDKSEINVGRVQGNDLMLPKGNVSKHHARLLFRDGRFIVTDLKSTNGTYVNGKKIAQATVVREGDKIFIGDFVIRLEGAQDVAGAPPPASDGPHDESTLAREREPNPPPLAPPMASPAPPPQGPSMPRPAANGPAVTLKASTHPPGARPVPGRSEAPVVQQAEEADDSEIHKPRPMGLAAGGPPPPRQHTMPLNQVAPLAPQMLRGPGAAGGPPPLPSEVQAPGAPQGLAPSPTQQPPPAARRNSTPPARPEPAAPPPARAAQPSMPPPRENAPPAVPAGARETIAREAPLALREASIPPPNRAKSVAPPPPVNSAKTEALASLAGRVAQAIDLGPLKLSASVPDALAKRVEAVAREQAKALMSEGALAGVDGEALSRDLVSELVGLGPIGAMLDDEDIVEIHAQRYDRVVVTRGSSSSAAESAFSSDEGVVRVLRRLCELASQPLGENETVVERRLPNGAMVLGVLPPVSKNAVISVRKKRTLEVSFDHLARQNTLSRPMCVFLEAVVAGRLNALVVGPSSADLPSFVAAFVHASGPYERVAIAEDNEEIVSAQAQVASFRRGHDGVAAAARTRPDRLVLPRVGGPSIGAMFDAIGDGCEGLVAGFAASSLKNGLSRLATQLVLQRPGLGAEAARELVAESFDTFVEVGSSPDGRRRVLRVSEVSADAKGFSTRDVFAFNETDSSFSPSGIVPKAASELGARGVKLDGSVFKRAAK
jgi:pilus assembly protein CpaF